MKNIVFIRPYFLTPYNRDIVYINELRDAGFKVEYWNISGYLSPKMPLSVEEVDADYHLHINTYEELRDKLRQTVISNTVFEVCAPKLYKNRALFKLLREFKCFTVLFISNVYDFKGIGRISRYQFIRMFIRENLAGKIKMMKSYLNCKYFDTTRLGTYDVLISPNPAPDVSGKVLINSYNYEKYRENSRLPNLIDGEYAVFLDQNFPLHPELIRDSKIPPNEEDAREYLELMRNFFTVIERQFNVRVVVAAHPSSNCTDSDFGNRPVLKNATHQLIRHAQFAILHCSSSVMFAVLQRCPLLYCYTNSFKALYDSDQFKRAYDESLFFKAPFIHVERHLDLPLPKPYIDNDACTEFKYTHMTRPEIENKYNKDILIEFFKGL